MTKQEELKELQENLRSKDMPLKKTATTLVFGEGNIDTKVMLIGEAPGFHEDQQGRPFVGNAGILLNKLLLRAGLKREDVYITNVVKYRPPDNRDPEPKEIEAFLPYLIRQIEIINPTIIVTLGRFSMNHFLPKEKISYVHGQAHNINGRIVVPMFHPAAALRATSVMQQIETDFEKLAQILQSPDEFVVNRKEDDSPQMQLF